MPRPAINDYTFYKIVNVNADCEMCYVGSSCDMKQRRQKHKYNCNNPNSKNYNNKVYKTIREHGGWCEFKIVELGTAEQLTHTESLVIEETYRIELKAAMNTYRCSITKDEMKEIKKEYNKHYKIDNFDKIKETRNEWLVNNAEKLKEQSKQYWINNIEKIKEYKNQKHTCECGGKYTTCSKAKHQNTAKHQNYLSNFKPVLEVDDP